MAAPGRKKGPKPKPQTRKPSTSGTERPAPVQRPAQRTGSRATPAEPPPLPRNTLGLVGLVVGVIALIGSLLITIGVVLGIAAMVLGFLSLKRVRRGEATNFRSSVSAMLLGFAAVGIAVSLIVYGQIQLNTPAGKRFTACDKAAGDDKDKQQECKDVFERER